MDIEYLLWLQNWREATGNFLTPFMQGWSDFAVGLLLFVPVLIYWCVNKKSGLFLMVSYLISLWTNSVIKLIVCAYRPWVRDARIIPAGDAIKTAGGYSFPSGHTMESGPIYAGLAALYHKKNFLITILCGLAILTTALSRNYLGVHTPQDVIVGSILAIVSVWIAAKIFAWLERHSDKENLFLIASVIIAVLSLVYVEFKSYPLDYVDGKILVDPVPMRRSAYQVAGMILAFAISRNLEKKFVKFSPTGLKLKGLAAAFVGFLIWFFFGMKLRYTLRETFLGLLWGNFAAGFINVFFAVYLWPLVIKKFSQD